MVVPDPGPDSTPDQIDVVTDHAPDAERLDGAVLGERIGDDTLPGIGDFPPDQALGVNDPNLVARDDVAMREARRRSEEVPASDASAPVADLVPPDGDDGWTDDEQQVVASEGEAGSALTPAEVEALHIEGG